ncbi:MAG TPA: M28 family peptidase [Acetobacteraceae bacterium]|nr:M28 family peptidase [Acetobacteraceae bacterium]
MPHSEIRELCERVDAARLMAHVTEFARRIKLSGTPEELESFAYLRAQLDALGFATDLILHDAYISLPREARLTVLGRAMTCITHSFSQPSAAGGTRGTVVYVGNGTDADFANRDVRGRIALVEGIANPAASLRASRAGVIGQIHVSPHEHIHEMCISPVWGSPSHETRADLPRAVVLSVSQADGHAIRDALARGETVDAVLEANVDTGWRKTPILVAEMASASAAADEPFVLFSGHHDTWHYGVMDNGTANATMLEVARICASSRAGWQRGLRLCFWSGHSHGRYSGSSWYVDENWDELDRRCVAHVNVDSTGGRGATVLEDAQSAAELRALAREAIGERAGQTLTGRRMSRAGDQSFWGVGLPAMFMSLSEQSAATATNVAGPVMGGGAPRKGGGLGWWWHTPADLIDKIDPELLARDTRVYVHTLTRLLQDRVLPLEYADHAADFLAELSNLQQKLGDRFDLTPIVERTRTLQSGAAKLRTMGDAAGVNAALMALSRALVPIEYTTGDRFGHDPALGQSSCPPLDPVRALASAPPDSDEARFLTVAARRSRNRVCHALDQANAILARLQSAAPAQTERSSAQGTARARVESLAT